jgi:hypothetical protein
MKKVLIILFSLIFFLSTTSVVLAGYRGHHRIGHHYRGHHRGYHHGYRGHGHYRYRHSHGRYWASWGIGVMTGAILSHALYRPTTRTVVYSTPATVVVPAAPAVVVKETTAPAPAKIVVPGKVVVATPALNVRQGPGLKHDVMTIVRQGVLLDVSGSAPGWLYVKTPSGQYGWVMQQYTNAPLTPVG